MAGLHGHDFCIKSEYGQERMRGAIGIDYCERPPTVIPVGPVTIDLRNVEKKP